MALASTDRARCPARKEEMVRLDCGHSVDPVPGMRLWCYYDMTFGVIVALPRSWSEGWYDFVVDGSPYCPKGNRVSYDALRLACLPCGVAQVHRSRELRLLAEGTSFELGHQVTLDLI